MSAALLARQTRQKPPSTISKSSLKSKGKTSLEFTPCTATASLLLYAQGATILCLHHDTLALERRFAKHVDTVKWISVDNVSERGAGRFVVSYDITQEAIVWDLFSGSEVSRFQAFEPISVAAWMRNGNVSFGNEKGEVILFSPSTREHYSTRTIYDPISALAPSSDCRTFAIGYKNGTILLAVVQPQFNILHTLSFARTPSPITGLAWHASSSKQKSDMLATQTSDGDLRVWSVAKPPVNEQPRVIRVLKRSSEVLAGPHWMGWSKNGRIIQYSDHETFSWDVRTKNVSFETIPTIEGVRGMASYGPTAVLFTLGPNYSVQQFDVEHPQMVANMQHFPLNGRPEDSTSIPSISASESEDDVPDPYDMLNKNSLAAQGADIERTASANSYLSQPESASSRTSSMIGRNGRQPSLPRTERSGTTFSLGTASQYTRGGSLLSGSSLGYPSSIQSPASTRSYRKASRLRNEVVRSPDDNKPLTDLFPFTRQRLYNMTYKPLPAFDSGKMTKDALRSQMIEVVFGYPGGDIEALVREEMKHHLPGSQGQVLLAKWLNDEADVLASMLTSNSSNSNLDWMLLALSGMGDQDKTRKIAQAVAQKMLSKGDVHTAVTILLSLDEVDLATDVYVKGHYYMEAILLTCLMKRSDWRRQSALVRQWGEHVVSNSQQHLALRCFSVAAPQDDDGAAQAAPPPQLLTYAQSTLPSQKFKASSTPSVISDTASSVPTTATPVPSVSMKQLSPTNRATPSLKLITTFGPPEVERHLKFPGLKSDDRTPTVQPWVTPIAESAIEPLLSAGGLRERVTTPGGMMRPRLASIGESPTGLNPVGVNGTAAIVPKPLPTPDTSEKQDEELKKKPRNSTEEPAQLLTSAKYTPIEPKKETPLTALPATALNRGEAQSPSQVFFDALAEERMASFMASDLRTNGMPMPWSIDMSNMSNTRADTPASYTTAQLDATGSIVSGQSTSLSFKTTQTPSITTRSIDRYTNGMDDSTSYFSKHHRKIRGSKRSVQGSITNESLDSEIADYRRSKHRHRDPSEDSRGRRHHHHRVPAVKRSPSSPRPMSPDRMKLYIKTSGEAKPRKSEKSSIKARSRSHPRSNRAISPERGSRKQRSVSRGRKIASERGGIALKSPKSPVSMSVSGLEQDRATLSDGPFRFVSADMARTQNGREKTQRSLKGTSLRGDPSPDRRGTRSRSGSRRATSRSRRPSLTERSVMTAQDWIVQRSTENTPRPVDDIPPVAQQILSNIDPPQHDPIVRPATANPRFVSELRRKELAAAELEARRASLMRRPSAPPLPSPAQLSHRKSSSSSDKINNVMSPNDSESSSPRKAAGKSGLPSTPRAMRHPNYDSIAGGSVPDVPDVPNNLLTLTDAVYRPSLAPIDRSMSAPPEQYRPQNLSGMPAHPAFQDHLPASRSSSRHEQRRGSKGERRISPTALPTSQEQNQGRAVDKDYKPPILAELQHLASPTLLPPPPPPPPFLPSVPSTNNGYRSVEGGIGVINIGLDDISTDDTNVQVIEIPDTSRNSGSMEPVTLDPPPPPTVFKHQRQRSTTSISTSVTGMSQGTGENLVGKFKTMADRMRSSSRGRGPKSPPIENENTISPYESIPPMPPTVQLTNGNMF